MKNPVKTNLVVLALAAFLIGPVLASAAPLGFYSITANDPEDAAIGEAQLWVDVTEPEEGQIAFTFQNDGPQPCSIAAVFFDDDSLLGDATITEGPGVSFSFGSSPPNLPGWDRVDPVFEASEGFSADSDPPVQPDGVNPGEYLTIAFVLQGGVTFSDVVDALFSGDLRIGIHVQGYVSGGSESFVNTPPVCPDEDEDGYGVSTSPWCDPPFDCDDSDPNVNPGAEEICNGIDDNCDGIIDDVDADLDGYIAEECGGEDCDDGRADVNPGMTESCCLEETCFDGIDNDCDGLVDSAEQGCNEWCMTMGASTVGTPTASGSHYTNYLGVFLVPLAAVLIWRGRKRRRG